MTVAKPSNRPASATGSTIAFAAAFAVASALVAVPSTAPAAPVAPVVVNNRSTSAPAATTTASGKTPKPPDGGGTAAAALESAVFETGIDSKEFVALVSPTLGKSESIRAVGPGSAAVTGTSATIHRVGRLAGEVRAAVGRVRPSMRLRAVVLMDREPDTTAPIALATNDRERDALLTPAGVVSADLDGFPVPDRLWRHGAVTVPVAGTGENRAVMADRLTLLYETTELPSGDYDLKVTLAERDKGVNPFDTGVLGRVLLANRYRAEPERPVVLAVTSPARTVLLALTLSASPSAAPPSTP